jgi:gamma-glutamyltranspeptidase/glutathione hydrolase
MRQTFLPIAAAFLLAGSSIAPARAIPAAVTAHTGMVSAADPRAAEAGAEMLRAGGSAVDAAIATLVTLNLVEPQSSGIGGGGYMVYSDRGGVPVTYDGRETAPHAAASDWWLVNGQPMPFDEAQPGGKSVGVPGNLRMIALAHREHGKLPWAKLFEPAIRLARAGFKITPRLHNSLDKYRATGALSAEARALFYEADGSAKPVGTTVKNLAFADFLDRIAKAGPDSFYVGPNAQAIVNAVDTASHNPSKMTLGDISTYDAKQKAPVCGTYRAYRICGMGPSSSGGITVLMTLKQLEPFDLTTLGPRSATAWHLIAESERLAYADRDKYVGDSDFVQVPLAGMADPAYLANRSALISPDKAMVHAEAGTPSGAPPVCAPAPQPERGTSHFVVVDEWGDVVSETSTIESSFGSGLMVNGYYLNNELTDFSFEPVKDGCPVANRVEGGKRPRSSMSPTIVYGPDGKVRLAVGAAGGSTIPAQVIKAIVGVIDFHLTAQQAIALPMLYAPGDTVYLESGTFLEGMVPELRAMGHTVALLPPATFKANAIEQLNGRWAGAADPRSEGAAVSE